MGPSPARYAYVDGLRGFAAAWVVLFHLWNRFYPGLSTQSRPLPDGPPGDPLAALSLFAFGFGYSGVTLFFVLSGLCIHLPQARRGVYRVAPGEFAARRFKRLYPAYLASIAFAVLALALPKLLLAAGGRSFDWWAEVHARDALINAAFLQQVWPESLEFNGVYWTLVYEVQFYTAYPALLWCLRRAGLVPVGVILFACEVAFASVPPPVPCFFLAKYFEWFLGVVAAEVLARNPARVSAVAAAVGAVAGLGGGACAAFVPAVYPVRDLLFAGGYFSLVLLAARGRGPVAAAFNWRSLAWLGAFSYSLYLVHVPVIDLVWVGLDRVAAARSGSPAVARWLSLAAVPASVAVAYVFYRLFERPFLRAPRSAAATPPSQPPDDKAAP